MRLARVPIVGVALLTTPVGAGAIFGGTDFTVYRPYREVTFKFTAAESSSLTGISLKSGTNALELDDLVYGSAVPEAGTWAMMIAGFGAVGWAMRRRRSWRDAASQH